MPLSEERIEALRVSLRGMLPDGTPDEVIESLVSEAGQKLLVKSLVVKAKKAKTAECIAAETELAEFLAQPISELNVEDFITVQDVEDRVVALQLVVKDLAGRTDKSTWKYEHDGKFEVIVCHDGDQLDSRKKRFVADMMAKGYTQGQANACTKGYRGVLHHGDKEKSTIGTIAAGDWAKNGS